MRWISWLVLGALALNTSYTVRMMRWSMRESPLFDSELQALCRGKQRIIAPLWLWWIVPSAAIQDYDAMGAKLTTRQARRVRLFHPELVVGRR